MLLSRKKALRLYCELIYKRICEPISTKSHGICEIHHIIPKCVANNKLLNKSKLNLIALYTHEHFLAHYYLTFIFPHNVGIHRAFYLMSNIKSRKKFNSINALARAYETSKLAISKKNKNKSYNQIYGNKRATSIKIKQKQKKINYMARIILVDK